MVIPQSVLRWSFAAAYLTLAGCGNDDTPPPPEASGNAAQGKPTGSSESSGGRAEESAPGPIALRDVREASGITWAHRFIDKETGSTYKLNPYDHGAGVLVADVNGDGHDDVLFLNFLGDNAVYLGKGDGTYEDGTAGSGLAMSRSISVGGCFGDIDNDGDQDVYVTTYKTGNKLFLNEGDGAFVDATEKAGVGYSGHSNSATLFDYDLDGDLDLYLTNIGEFTTGTIDEEMGYYVGVPLELDVLSEDLNIPVTGEKNRLWRNDGKGVFEDVTDAAGVGSASWNGDATVWDYDGDGDLDVYVANMFGINNLFRNNGDGTFTDVAADALGLTSWGAIGCRFFDADNDLLADLYVVDMHSDMWLPDNQSQKVMDELKPAAKYRTPMGPVAPARLGQEITGDLDRLVKQRSKVLFGNSFFHNQGAGKFQERSDASGLETFWPWGIAVADFDNDGLQDVFLPTGMSYPYLYWPNMLLQNKGDLAFEDVADAAGIESPRPGGEHLDLVIKDIKFTRSSRTAAVLDHDGDGDLDLLVNNFNDVPFVFANESSSRNWVALKLTGDGKKTNRDAFGSTVVVEAGGMRQIRTIENATGYLAQSTRTAYFGLGNSKKIDKVTVKWLGGEEVDVTDQVTMGQVNEITQQ